MQKNAIWRYWFVEKKTCSAFCHFSLSFCTSFLNYDLGVLLKIFAERHSNEKKLGKKSFAPVSQSVWKKKLKKSAGK